MMTALLVQPAFFRIATLDEIDSDDDSDGVAKLLNPELMPGKDGGVGCIYEIDDRCPNDLLWIAGAGEAFLHDWSADGTITCVCDEHGNLLVDGEIVADLPTSDGECLTCDGAGALYDEDGFVTADGREFDPPVSCPDCNGTGKESFRAMVVSHGDGSFSLVNEGGDE